MAEHKCVYADRSLADLDEMRAILDPFGVEIVDGLCRNVSELNRLSKNATIVVSERIPLDDAFFSANPAVKMAVSSNVGFDHIDRDAATKHGVRVCNNPTYNTHECAEHTLGLILSLSRKIIYANRHVKEGYFNIDGLAPLQRVHGSVVGLLGFGRIARFVAQKLIGLGVEIIFYDPYVEKDDSGSVKKVSLEALLKNSDYLSLHLPLTPETHHLLNADSLSMMKPTACIINISRGDIIDTKALVEALTSGKLAGAALDVIEDHESFDSTHPLCGMENVILTPHSAWYSDTALKQCKVDMANEIVRFVRGEQLSSLQNPEVLDGEKH